MVDAPFKVEDSGWFIAMVGLSLGLVLGSFITMLSYRLPRKQSIVFPGSRCVSCHSALGVRDLVPLFSWLIHRGRCRHCGVSISARYPVIEVVTAVGSWFIFYSLGWSLLLFPALLALVAVVTCATWFFERTKAPFSVKPR